MTTGFAGESFQAKKLFTQTAREGAMSGSEALSFEEFVELVKRLQQADEEAADRLWPVVNRWIRSSDDLRQLARNDGHLLDDATTHVVLKLRRGKWQPRKSRSLDAVQRWVYVTAKRYILSRLSRRPKHAPGGPYVEAAMAPEPPDTETESVSRKLLERIISVLPQIDRIVFGALRHKRGRLDWFAFYLLEGRIGLYTLLKRVDGDSVHNGSAWFMLTEATLPWSVQDGQRCIKRVWPCIAEIWDALKQSAAPDGASLTIRRVINAVKALAPGVSITGTLYYKWRERLRMELKRLLQNGAFDGIDPDAIKFWRAIYGI